MKNFIIIIIALLLTSCYNSENSKSNIADKINNKSELTTLDSSKKETKAHDKLNKTISVNQILNKIIETKYYKIETNSVEFFKNDKSIILNDTIKNYVEKTIKAFEKQANEYVRGMPKEMLGGFVNGVKYNLNIKTEHYITTYGTISVLIQDYQNFMGAHGSTSYKIFNFDLLSNKTITLSEFANLKSGSNLDKFNKLLVKHFNRQDCFDRDPKIDENYSNFIIKEDSITVFFGEYELGPYACGIPSVDIPIEELP